MIHVLVAINDPRNGALGKRIDGISIESFIELEPAVIPAPRFSLGRDFIGVHRAKFRFEGRQTWVGNWCWDSLAMKDSEAAKLIACCLAQRNAEFPVWSVQSASGGAAIALSDKVAAGKTVTPMEIVDAMNAERVGRRG